MRAKFLDLRRWVALLFLVPTIAVAQNRVVTVALDGTGDYRDPVAAIESIQDASESRRYVVKLGPGTYKLNRRQIVTGPFVSIVGSGPENTIIQSAISSTSSWFEACVIRLTTNFGDPVRIANLSIKNHGIYGESSLACGIDVTNSLTVILDNVWVDLRVRASEAAAIRGHSTFLELNRVSVNVVNKAAYAEKTYGYTSTYDGGSVSMHESKLIVRSSAGTFSSAMVAECGLKISNSQLTAIGAGGMALETFICDMDIRDSQFQGGSPTLRLEIAAGVIRDSEIISRYDSSSQVAVRAYGFDAGSNAFLSLRNLMVRGTLDLVPPSSGTNPTHCSGVLDEALQPLPCN